MQLSWSLLMLVTQHVSGIIMPIIRSTRRDDKPHTVFCTGRAEWTWGDEVDPVCTWCSRSHQVHTGSTSSPQVHYCGYVSRITTAIKCTRDPPHLLVSTTVVIRITTAINCRRDPPHLLMSTTVVIRITTAIKCRRDPPHLLKSTNARPLHNTVCGLSSFTLLLMMGIMMPETCWVTNINKLQLNCI